MSSSPTLSDGSEPATLAGPASACALTLKPKVAAHASIPTMCSAVADHAPGPASGTRGIQDAQRVGGPDGDAVAWLGSGHRLLPMQVTAGDQGGRCPRALREDAAPWLWLHSPIARSRIGLYPTTRLTSDPRRKPTSRPWGRRCAAPVRAAKPPYATECTAPMRVQAGIATTASGIIGRWMITRRQARDTVMGTRESSAGRRRPARLVRSADQRGVMM